MSGALDAAVARSAAVAEVRMGRGVLAEAGALLRRHFGDRPACLIGDDKGFGAAGPAVEAALREAGIEARRHVVPASPRPKPSVELSASFREQLAQDDATPVAVGSGVMNDVVKHAAFGLGRDYLCVATAASMDGYTSAGAPLSERGFKKTIPCRPARAVLADLDVVAAAPPEMTGWGFGDLSGKVPAGGDWIIADALGIEPIDQPVWDMVQGPLHGWLGDAGPVGRGEPDAVAGLFEGLALVGLAMERHGSSRPASGADHQIAHLWEMQDLRHRGERVSHGACVAVGGVAALRLYDWLLSLEDLRLDADAAVPTMAEKAAAIRGALGDGEVAARALEETAAKHAEPAALRDRLRRLASVWPDLRARLRDRLWTADRMSAALGSAGAPATPEEIGLTPADLRHAAQAALWLRSRYTLLDLLAETGLLNRALAEALPDPLRERTA